MTVKFGYPDEELTDIADMNLVMTDLQYVPCEIVRKSVVVPGRGEIDLTNVFGGTIIGSKIKIELEWVKPERIDEESLVSINTLDDAIGFFDGLLGAETLWVIDVLFGDDPFLANAYLDSISIYKNHVKAVLSLENWSL